MLQAKIRPAALLVFYENMRLRCRNAKNKTKIPSFCSAREKLILLAPQRTHMIKMPAARFHKFFSPDKTATIGKNMKNVNYALQ